MGIDRPVITVKEKETKKLNVKRYTCIGYLYR